jgi:hypothetical protein
MKEVRVVFSPEAEEVYNYLINSNSKTDKTILKSIDKKVEIIKSNIHFGNPISKDLIPKEYIEKYNVTNLFRVPLPKFWRMLYTLTEGEMEIEIVAFILDVLDHEEYNKKFGYKSR